VSDEAEFVPPRFASRGRAFVYVIPCRDEDLLKVGFSRDPLQRLQAFHPRFFRFFDLDRGFLIGVDHVRDARRIERRFITAFAECRSPAPLVVRDEASGRTEWYRGVYPEASDLGLQVCATEGFVMHASLRRWLRNVFEDRAALLFAWSSRMLEAVEYERFNGPPAPAASALERALRDALDCFDELAIPIETLVPEAVFRWYQNN